MRRKKRFLITEYHYHMADASEISSVEDDLFEAGGGGRVVKEGDQTKPDNTKEKSEGDQHKEG